MKSIIITDAKYRSSLAAVYALREKYDIILCQTDDYKKTPLSFNSKYVKRTAILHEKNYAEELASLICEYHHPVVLPIGAKTTELLSRQREKFAQICDFFVPSPEALNGANDKKLVADTAIKLGIPTPEVFTGEPDSYPVIIKPSCGEKLGLRAEERYIRANNRDEYIAAIEKMKRYDNQPIVQQYISGDGIGVCLIRTDKKHTAGIICHKRVRELPISGGPSCCCETIYNEQLIKYSEALLDRLDFCGIAMVEFKGGRLLEINPRVWGSFPLTYHADSNFALNWVKCAMGLPYDPPIYKCGVRMNFIVNDSLSAVKYLISGHVCKFFEAIGDIFNPFVKEALFSFKDPLPFFTYIKNLF